jgi:hypothetical protein
MFLRNAGCHSAGLHGLISQHSQLFCSHQCVALKLNKRTHSNVTKTTNSVALVSGRTILTERPPFVGEVSANLLRIGGVACSA